MRPCIPSCAVVHRDARAPQILPARNIDCMHNIAARTQHYSVHAATAQCTCIPACALRKRSGTREVEVLRCCHWARPMSSLPVEITHVSAVVKETSHKIRPASPAQANNRARRTHLSRIPIQSDLSARLRSRPKVASARPKLASTGRAQLRRAACAAAAGLLQARTEHHDRVAAPRWLPARLRRAGCSRPLLSR